jgi:pseudoazurin
MNAKANVLISYYSVLCSQVKFKQKTEVNMKLRSVGMALLLMSNVALAAEHTVEMKNKGEGGMMVFEPSVVNVAVGDTVKFVSTNPGHNSESVEGLIPEGATPWKGAIGQDIEVTVDKEGVYVFKCAPHQPMSMVGVIVAGKPTNLDKIKADAEAFKATLVMKKDRLDTYLGQIQQ